jgi:hypothetical protein
MNPVLSIWRALVQRRLLPVAILLVAALGAIPFVLAKDADPVAPAPAAPAKDAAGDSDALAEPVVSLVTDADHKERRRVLGASKNPFQPGRAPKATATPTPAPATGLPTGSTPAVPTGDTGGTGGVPSGPVGTTPPAVDPPSAEPPQTPKPKYELYSLSVRFGSTQESTMPKRNLPRLTALPSAEDPMLVYLGLEGDGKTAVFLVDASVEPQGDGVCKPNPAVCETIHMRVGDTEFFDVTDDSGNVSAQYQLDLLEIKRRITTSAAKAKAARAKASKAGRRVLRTRRGASGPLRYRYDMKSGTVRKLSKRGYKVRAARMARAAMASAGAF